MEKSKYFLEYSASHPAAIISYSTVNMVLEAHSNASYLTEQKSRSRSGGNIFMSNNAANPENKGAVLTIALIIKKT